MFDRRGLFGGSGKNPAGEIYTMPYKFVLNYFTQNTVRNNNLIKTYSYTTALKKATN